MRLTRGHSALLRAFLAALALAQAGCGGCNPPAASPPGFVATSAAPRVLTERAFVQDPSLRLRSTDTAVFRLEAGAFDHEDTGQTGVDVIPLKFDHAVRHSLCLGVDEGHAHTASLADATGKVLGTVQAGDCVLFELEAGEYSLRLQSDGVGDAQGELAFVRPVAGPDYRPRGHLVAQAPLPETSPPGYSVPAGYDQIPAGCTMLGPWSYDDALCRGGDATWNAYCATLEADDCAARVADCAANWGTQWDETSRGIKDFAWQSCFAGSRNDYLAHATQYYDGVMKPAGDKWVGQYCSQVVAADCAAEWNRKAENRPQCEGLEQLVPYKSLALEPGQVAVLPQSMLSWARTACPPEPDTLVAVVDGRCADLRHRVGGVVLGPETQVALYAETGFGGRPYLLENLGESTAAPFCLPLGAGAPQALDPVFWALKHSASPSLAVNRANGSEADRCRAERMGLWCLADAQAATPDEVYAAHRDLDVAPPLPGELLLLGAPTLKVSGAWCAPALVVNTGCDDLSRLGFERRVDGVLRPSKDTFAELFFSAGFAGKRTMVDSSYEYRGSDDASRGQYQTLPDPNDPGLTGRGEAASVRLWRTWTYNHATLISTGRCDECDLEGVDFAGEDLTRHSLVHSDLHGAKLTGTNLTGTDLGYANLTGAVVTGAIVSGTHLGCASLSNVDSADPQDPHRSTLKLGAAASWTTRFTVNGVEYDCTPTGTDLTGAKWPAITDLSEAKLPIDLLPKDSWRMFQLAGATLLDLRDGYALDGLDLSHGSYAKLSMGGAALSMRGVNADGAALEEAQLARIDFGVREQAGQRLPSHFGGADLRGAELSYTNLEEADLSGADLSTLKTLEYSSPTSLAHAYLRNANLAGAAMGGVNLTGAYLYGEHASVAGATLNKAKLAGGVFSSLDFRQCTLEDASLSGAQLVGARFDDPKTNLKDAVLNDAYLQGASFAGADLTGASFVGAFVSQQGGCWGYTDVACTDNQVRYATTDLGTTDISNDCPNASKGPCVGDKLVVNGTTTAPIPPCVPDIFGNDICMSYVVLRTGTIPSCGDRDGGVMSCGCLVDVSCPP